VSITLLNLRTEVLRRADMLDPSDAAVVPTGPLTSAEVNSYINQSIAELHDLLTTTYEDYFLKRTTFTKTSGGDNEQALPTDFFKLRKLQYQVSGGRWRTIRRVPLEELDRYDNVVSVTQDDVTMRGYVLTESTLFLLPEASPAGTYRVWYARTYTALELDADTTSDLQGWHEYVIVDAAMKCHAKEQDYEAVAVKAAEKERLKQRIINAATIRDAGEPAHIADVGVDVTPWGWG
jgi:hypothetical protein